MTMSPLVMSSRPTIIRSSVDFPQPDGPTSIMNSPSAMSRLTSLTAGNPSPYCLTMWFMVIAAIRTPRWLGRRQGGGERGRRGGRPSSRSSLHRTGGEAGDDAALEQQHDDDD